MFFEGKISSSDEIYITNIRHKEAIGDSIEALKLVKKSLEDDMPEDFSEYEEYMNFTTDYEISDNDLFININIPEYSNYYYYLIIKINRY